MLPFSQTSFLCSDGGGVTHRTKAVCVSAGLLGEALKVDVACEPRGLGSWGPGVLGRGLLTAPVLSGLFQDGDSSSDCRSDDSPGSRLPSFVLPGKTLFPEMFQTSHLLFYERFRAYQDYILGEQALCHASCPQRTGRLRRPSAGRLGPARGRE